MQVSFRNALQLALAVVTSILFAIVFNYSMPILWKHGAWTIALLPCMGGFFLLMLLRPQIAVAFILLTRTAIDPLTEITRGTGHGMGIGAGINLLVILLAGFLWFQYYSKLKLTQPLISWIVFLCISFCAVFYSPISSDSFRLFLNFFTYMCMWILPLLMVKNEKDKFFWLKILLCSSLVPSLVGNAQIILLHGQGRILGTFQHPNIFAFYLVLMVVVAFYLLKSPGSHLSPFWRNVLRAYVLNLLILLLLTQTRSAWIACWLVFFIYGLKADRKYILWTIFLIFLALLIPSVQQRVLDIFQGIKGNPDIGNSWTWRVQLWKDSLGWIFKKPVFGYGLGSFEYYAPWISEIVFKRNMEAHNTYLENLFEMGIFGLVAFIALFWNMLRFFFRSNASLIKHDRARKLQVLVIAYIFSYMVICFSDNINYYLVLNWYSWFFIGLMMVSKPD